MRPAEPSSIPRCAAHALAEAPRPLPAIPGVPLLGGLVGYTAYDAVRYFERLPARSLSDTKAPHAHYVAPRSMLVFDHLTRSVALLHDGSEAERQSLRREVIQALRGAVPTILTPGGFSPATPSLSAKRTRPACASAQEYIGARRRLSAGARGALRGPP
jgi:anthranilate synthase component I